MSHNDTSVHPQGALSNVYAGVMNPSEHSVSVASDAYGSSGDLSDAGTKPEVVHDSVEGAPGIIEGAELAPLGEGKVAADPGLMTKATAMAKDAYAAATGEKQ
ncbi:hypothetical protein P7C73_g1032, partial [Tremellales sp. Uapishka_1]